MAGEDASPVGAESVEDLLDRMTDAFMGLDDEWRLTYLNEQGRHVVCEAIGEDLTVEELQGQTIWGAIPALQGTVFEEQYRAAMTTQSAVSFEAEYEPLDAWFEVNVYPSESGLSVYFRDVSERRQQRTELEKRETVLREMYEVISDQDLSFEGRVEELLTIGRRELGIDYGTLSRIRDGEYRFEVVQAPNDTLQQGDVIDLDETHCERVVLDEERLVTGDVAEEHPELTDTVGYRELGINCYLGTPVVVDGDVYGTFCFYDSETRIPSFSEWEVTLVDTMGRWIGSALERKLAREQLTRQNERLEQFATIVSHDLRNPLGVAQKRLDLLARDSESDHLSEVKRAHDRMETLIDDVLTMTRVGETVEEVEEVEMAAVAKDAWDSVPASDASLDVDDDLVVICDRSRIQQLLENLIRNSIEHGPEAGSGEGVTIQIAGQPGGFVVADDGPGIPEGERDSVFEYGHSGSGGSGVGLAIVHQIATAHGWSVSLTDDWDGGARFEFQTTGDQ